MLILSIPPFPPPVESIDPDDAGIPTVIGLDPGDKETAWVSWHHGSDTILDKGIAPNAEVLAMLYSNPGIVPFTILVIEQVASYGMAVGEEVFETVFWSGRFAEAWANMGGEFARVPRLEVKMNFCHDSKAKDKNIRQALMDRFGSKGTKKKPGTLYGVVNDIWSALAVAVTYCDKVERQESYRPAVGDGQERISKGGP